jgi:hypothetical protein
MPTGRVCTHHVWRLWHQRAGACTEPSLACAAAEHPRGPLLPSEATRWRTVDRGPGRRRGGGGAAPRALTAARGRPSRRRARPSHGPGRRAPPLHVQGGVGRARAAAYGGRNVAIAPARARLHLAEPARARGGARTGHAWPWPWLCSQRVRAGCPGGVGPHAPPGRCGAGPGARGRTAGGPRGAGAVACRCLGALHQTAGRDASLAPGATLEGRPRLKAPPRPARPAARARAPQGERLGVGPRRRPCGWPGPRFSSQAPGGYPAGGESG